MAEEDDDDAILIGISLTNETFSNPGLDNEFRTDLGFVCMKEPLSSITILKFRQIITSQLITLPPLYGFLTKQGWPVSLTQEAQLHVKHLLRPDGLVFIKKVYDKPRIGVKTAQGTAIGFLFIDNKCSLLQARREIQSQLGYIGGSASSTYQFTDSNGWPVSLEQEEQLTIQDIKRASVIYVCSEIFSQEICNGSDDSTALHFAKRKRPPLVRQLTYHSSKDVIRRTSEENEAGNHGKMHQILISYVRAEAAQHALDLKAALLDIGYRVYLDIHEIKTGIDWQDALNYAVSNCEVFVPLVSARYGETQWTNREVKLADVLGKFIIPVSFLDMWPPRCLAIQFATTQYVQWKTDKDDEDEFQAGTTNHGKDPKKWELQHVKKVAQEIGERYSAKLSSSGPLLTQRPSVTSRLHPAFSVLEPKNSIDDGENADRGKLILISVHPIQKDFGNTVKKWFEDEGYTAWCSAEMEDCPEVMAARSGDPGNCSCSSSQEMPLFSQLSQVSVISEDPYHPHEMRIKQLIFQQKADEAAVVIFVLSEAFSKSKTAQQQVYYCEQRKVVVPLSYEEFCMPGWMSMLIGTNPLVSCDMHRDGYKDLLMARIKKALNPGPGDMSEEINEAKIARAVSLLKKTIPSEGCVYVSGSTKFYCGKSETLCRAIGKCLAVLDSVTIVTGGFFGAGDVVAKAFFDGREELGKPSNVWHVLPTRDEMDRQHQARQNSDHTFQTIPYGMTVFSGDSVRERETIVSRVIDICILIEGGPGAAHEAEQFAWCDHHVIPIKCTGGAAGGKFNVPDKIYEVPQGVSADDWLILDSKDAMEEDIANAVMRIVAGLQTTIRLYQDGAATLRKKKLSLLKKSKQRPSLSTYRAFIMSD